MFFVIVIYKRTSCINVSPIVSLVCKKGYTMCTALYSVCEKHNFRFFGNSMLVGTITQLRFVKEELLIINTVVVINNGPL